MRLSSAPGQVTKLLCFPSSLLNAFLSSTCFWESDSSLFLSLCLRAVSYFLCWKSQRKKSDWQQSHKTGMNVWKLSAGFSPVWIYQHEGSWINIFKHFFRWMMTHIMHANTKGNSHQMHHGRKINLQMYSDLKTSETDWNWKRQTTCTFISSDCPPVSYWQTFKITLLKSFPFTSLLCC